LGPIPNPQSPIFNSEFVNCTVKKKLIKISISYSN
jgi:hypothetical protein